MMKTRIGMVLLSGFFLCSSGCTSPAEDLGKTMPESLKGVWETDDPKYAEQELELTERALVFHTAKDSADVYSIIDILATPTEEGTLYEIAHTGSDGGEMILSLLVHDGDSTLVFKNQRFRIWRRVALAP